MENNDEDNDSKMEWYGIKSLSSPKSVKDLTPFEKINFIQLISNLEKLEIIFEISCSKTERMKALNKTMTFAEKKQQTSIA